MADEQHELVVSAWCHPQSRHAARWTASRPALRFRPDTDSNPISWLAWHLCRVQDDHLADAFNIDQVLNAQGWFERFGLPFDRAETGYGQSTEEVGRVTASADSFSATWERSTTSP